MNDDFKISVIVPVYNTEKYLKECLDSLVNQSYGNIEIVLVDDGSTDSSGNICDEYSSRDNRIVVIHKKNGGLVSAWREGVKSSTGEYLCFVDGDDWIDSNMLTEMSEMLTGSEKEIICSDYVIEREQKDNTICFQRLGKGEYTGDSLENIIKSDIIGSEQRLIHFSRCMKLISRKLFVDNMHYPEDGMRMGEDVAVILPSILDAERIVNMDHKAYYHYRLVESSMVHKYDRNLKSNVDILYEKILKIITDKRREDLLKKADSEYLFLLLLCVKNEIRGNGLGIRESIESIKQIKNSEGVRTILNTADIKINDKANCLLYMVLKNPGFLNIWALKLAFKIYYR